MRSLKFGAMGCLFVTLLVAACHQRSDTSTTGDAGTTLADGGTVFPSDGGSSHSDGGTTQQDGGSTSHDGGGGAWPLGQCAAGQSICEGTGVRSCVLADGGYVWGPTAACASMQSCVDGQCLDNAVTITTDTELCGAHAYAGAFVVQGGARVTCSSGDLTVAAATILIDPSSKIDLSGTGTGHAADQGTAGGFCSQSSGSGGGGAGGSYGARGAAGGDGVNNYYNQYYGDQCMFCGGATGGMLHGSDSDMVVESGWPGGSGCSTGYQYQCSGTSPGGAPGGAVRLIAREKITVQGQLLANGAQGTTGDEGGGGGGSGGGLLLVAPSVELSPTAVLSSSGGPGGSGLSNDCAQESPSTSRASGGAGGAGRVKILHGTDYTGQGNVTGAQSEGWMPPVDFTSTTHPDPTRFYNDGFTSLQVSWQQPYDGAKGTWYLLDQNAETVLSPANGTFTTALSVMFPESQLAAPGDWYLHVLTVNSDDSISTVSNWFRVHINGAPHNITSSSHPDQSMWYTGASKTVATFAWTAPDGVPENSFVGVWYRLDHTTAPAMPDKTGRDGWTFTRNAQTLLQQDSDGKMLGDGTWYFHVVSEDTMGNLTKAVGSYQIQLGNEPAMMNFFGYVKTSGGAPAANVTVGLQPYGLTATTDANGYFIFNGVYQGSYVLSTTVNGATKQTDVHVDPSMVPYNVVVP